MKKIRLSSPSNCQSPLVRRIPRQARLLNFLFFLISGVSKNQKLTLKLKSMPHFCIAGDRNFKRRGRMGLHLVALLKLNPGSSRLIPVAGSLLFPFLVKLLLSLRFVRGTRGDLVYAWRFFFFQLGRITSGNDTGNQPNGSRWERAVRLVHRRLTRAGRSPAQLLEDEDSLRTLSMLAL